MSEKLKKRLFIIAVAANYVLTAIYNFLTPNMSDDIIYGDVVAKAGSFLDLFAQEYEHYMFHGGRSVAHFILRIFLFTGSKTLFNIVGAAVFVGLGLLIYLNVDHRKAWDLRVYGAIAVLMWLFDPTISNTVFWETGACNYLFTAFIMMGYITVYRRALKAGVAGGGNSGVGGEARFGKPGFSVLMLVLGVLAGWCNENTSGGVVFFSAFMIFLGLLGKRAVGAPSGSSGSNSGSGNNSGSENNSGSGKASAKSGRLFGVSLWQWAGLVGNLIGFVIMIFSPGNFSRASVSDEEHTGILALAARFLKITLNIKNNYLVLVLVFAVLVIMIAYKTGSFKAFYEAAKPMLLFGLMFLLTDYALIAVYSSQLRTYFGGGVFLMTAVIQGFAWVVNEGFKDELVQIVATSLVAVYLIILLFTYVEEGANLARIKREFDERDAYLTEIAKGEEKVVEAPMLRPEWETRFSMGYESDLTEDKFNWLNLSYSEHYGLWYIIGVDREGWEAY